MPGKGKPKVKHNPYDRPTWKPPAKQPWKQAKGVGITAQLQYRGIDYWKDKPGDYMADYWRDQDYRRGGKKAPSYQPTFWDDPFMVARYRNAIKALPPGKDQPKGIEPELEAAYEYFRIKNNNKPWSQWEYLEADDPGREWLANIPEPPDAAKWGNEWKFPGAPNLLVRPENRPFVGPYAPEYYQSPIEKPPPISQESYDLLEKGIVSDEIQQLIDSGQIPDVMESYLQPGGKISERGMTEEEVADLEPWQRVASGLFATPQASGAMIGGFAGALYGGPAGLAFGAGLGAGLAGLSQKFPGSIKLMELLNIPYETLEASLGFLNMAYARGIEETKKEGFTAGATAVAEFLPRLNDMSNFLNAWEASKLYYESINIPQVVPDSIPVLYGINAALSGYRTLESRDPIEVDPDKQNWRGLYYAFQQLEQGRGMEDVEAEMRAMYGFTGQMRDLLGAIILDPLNYVGLVAMEPIGMFGKIMGDDALRLATRIGKGPKEAMEHYKVLLRTGMFGKTTADIAQAPGLFGNFQRWAAGITKTGADKMLQVPTPPTKLNQIAGGTVAGTVGGALGYGIGSALGPIGGAVGAGIAGTLGFKWAYPGGFKGLVGMTAASRATEIVNSGALNLQILMEAAENDPVILTNLIKSVQKTPTTMAHLLGLQFLQAPEGQVLPLMLRDFGKTADEMLLTYTAASDKRAMLNNIANLLDDDIDEILFRLGSESKDTVIAELKTAAKNSSDPNAAVVREAIEEGSLTADALNEIMETFTKDGVPYNEELYRAQLYSGAVEHASEWAAKYFNVQPDPTWSRMAKLVKSAQSLVLLGLNPLYLVNNVINNEVVSIARGVFGIRTPGMIQDIWQRIGVYPERLRAGVGAEGIGEMSDSPKFAAIRDAATTKDMIHTVDQFFRATNDKLGVFSKMSMQMEKWASAQAYTSGYLQAYARYFIPGIGFKRMPGALESALANVDPNLPNVVYDAIRSGMNKAEIEDALWSGLSKRGVDSFIPEVAVRHGLSDQEATDILKGSGVVDLLDEQLKNVADPTRDQIDQIFENVQGMIEKKLDEIAQIEGETVAARAAEKVKAEGARAAFEIFDQASLEYIEHWFNHFINMGETARAAQEIVDAGGSPGHLWRASFVTAQRSWNRLFKKQRAEFAGIANALGLESGISRAMLGEQSAIHKAWYEFYKKRLQLYDDLNRNKITYGEVQETLMVEYNKTFRIQERAQRKMDKLFVELFATQFSDKKGARQAASAWRSGVAKIRAKMHQDMINHRESGAETWSKFLRDQYLQDARKLHEENVKGAQEMYAKATGLDDVEPSPAPEVPKLGEEDWQLGGSDITEGREARTAREAARKVAAEQEITATQPKLGEEPAKIVAEPGVEKAVPEGAAEQIPAKEVAELPSTMQPPPAAAGSLHKVFSAKPAAYHGFLSSVEAYGDEAGISFLGELPDFRRASREEIAGMVEQWRKEGEPTAYQEIPDIVVEPKQPTLTPLEKEMARTIGRSEEEMLAAKVAEEPTRRAYTPEEQRNIDLGMAAMREAGLQPVKQYLENIIRKYGGEDGAKIKDLAEAPEELVRQALEERARVKSEIQKQVDANREALAAKTRQREAEAAEVRAKVEEEKAAIPMAERPLPEQMEEILKLDDEAWEASKGDFSELAVSRGDELRQWRKNAGEGYLFKDAPAGLRETIETVLDRVASELHEAVPGKRTYDYSGTGVVVGGIESTYPKWYGDFGHLVNYRYETDPVTGAVTKTKLTRKKDAILQAFEDIRNEHITQPMLIHQRVASLVWESIIGEPEYLKWLGEEYDASRLVDELARIKRGVDWAYNIDMAASKLDDISKLMEEVFEYYGDRDIPEWIFEEISKAQDKVQDKVQKFEMIGEEISKHDEMMEFVDDAVAKRAEVERIADDAQSVLDNPDLITPTTGRDLFQNILTDIYDLPEEQVTAVMAVTDARARYKAKQEGITVEEWYIRRIAGGVKGRDPRNGLFQAAEPPEHLVMLHNLSANDLAHAADLGGLPVPSVAVIKSDLPFDKYGEITLIGDRNMIDPQISETSRVFSRDIYSPTFPDLHWKPVKMADANAIMDRLRQALDDTEDRSRWEYFDLFVNYPDKKKLLDLFDRNEGPKLAFLREKGYDIYPEKFERQPQKTWMIYDPLKEFYSQHEDYLRTMRYEDGWAEAFKTDPIFTEWENLLKQAINEYVNKVEDPKVRDRLREAIFQQTFDEEGSIRSYSKFLGILDDHKTMRYPVMEIDTSALDKLINEKMIGLETEYKAWTDEILSVFQPPRIKVNGRLKPLTLSNVVDNILSRRLKAGERSWIFGKGEAAAVGAEEFRSIDEMRAAMGQIADETTVHAAIDKTQQAALDNYISHVGDNYAYSDTWEMMSDAHRALGYYLKGGLKKRSPGRMRNMLGKYGFSNLTDEAIEAAIDAAETIRDTPTAYFEGKLQRGVGIGEFIGAVAPDDIDPETLRILEDRGLKVEYYRRNDPESRMAAVEKFYDQQGVLFQEAEESQPMWYYKLDRLISDSPQGKFSKQQLEAMVRKGGIRADEIKWSGIEAFLEEAGDSITKQEVLEWLDTNRQVRIVDVIRNEGAREAHEMVWKALRSQKTDLEKILRSETRAARSFGKTKYLPIINDSDWGLMNAGVMPMRDFKWSKRAEAAVEAYYLLKKDWNRISAEPMLTPKHSSYQEAGYSENYNELLLTMPRSVASGADPDSTRKAINILNSIDKNDIDIIDLKQTIQRDLDRGGPPDGATQQQLRRSLHTLEQQQAALKSELDYIGIPYPQAETLEFDSNYKFQQKPFKSGHWDEENILVHVRFNERIVDGKKTLFIEEIQSDWMQGIRKYGVQVIADPTEIADISNAWLRIRRHIKNDPLLSVQEKHMTLKKVVGGLDPLVSERTSRGFIIYHPKSKRWILHLNVGYTWDELFRGSFADFDEIAHLFGDDISKMAKAAWDEQLPGTEPFGRGMAYPPALGVDETERQLLNKATFEIPEGMWELREKYKRVYPKPTQGRARSPLPDAPFQKTYTELALKRMLRWAAENDFEQIAWTSGDQQARRWTNALQQAADYIEVKAKADGSYDFLAEKGSSVIADLKGTTQDEIALYISEGLAEDLVKQANADHEGMAVVEGQNIKVGGKGMRYYYDNMVPKVLEKYGKQWGVKVRKANLETVLQEQPVIIPVTMDLEPHVNYQHGRGRVRYEVEYRNPDRQMSDIEWSRELYDTEAEAIARKEQLSIEHIHDLWYMSFVDPEKRMAVVDVVKGKENAIKIRNAYIEKYADKVPAIDVTPEMRESVLQGQPLFQKSKAPKGGIQFVDDNKAILYAFEKPDITTALHEVGHIFRKDLSAAELEVAETWVRQEAARMNDLAATGRLSEAQRKSFFGEAASIEGIDKAGEWTRSGEELWARAFERYLLEGIAPTQQLRPVFEKLKRWFLEVYTSLTGSSLDVNISPELRQLFDNMLGKEAAEFNRTGQGLLMGEMEGFQLRSQKAQESVFKPQQDLQPTMGGLEEAMEPQIRFGEQPRAVTPMEMPEKPVQPLEGLAAEPVYYAGETLAVRPVQKKTGLTGYAVHRPSNKNAILDEFATVEQANFIAKYIEDNYKGNYSSPQRKAAWRAWEAEGSKPSGIEIPRHPKVDEYIASLAPKTREYAEALDTALRTGGDWRSVPADNITWQTANKVEAQMQQFYIATADEVASLAGDVATGYDSLDALKASPDWDNLVKAAELTRGEFAVDDLEPFLKEFYREQDIINAQLLEEEAPAIKVESLDGVGPDFALEAPPSAQELETYYGEAVSGRYATVVAENLKHMGTKHSEWKAVEISGIAETKQGGMPKFNFPEGYKPAPSKYKNVGTDMNCELCAHPIKNAYWLQNDSKKYTLLVGSECVTKFEGISGVQLGKEAMHQARVDFLENAKKILDMLADEFQYEGQQSFYGKSSRRWYNQDAKAIYERAGKQGYMNNVYRYPKVDAMAKGTITQLINFNGENIRHLLSSALDLIELKNKERPKILDPLSGTYFQVAEPVDNPAFKAWFTGSKIVEPDNTPKVVYHGTVSDFTEFQRLEGDWGFHFGSSEQAGYIAFEKASKTKRMQVDRWNKYFPVSWVEGAQPNIMPVYLKMEKPFILQDDPGQFKPRSLGNFLMGQGADWKDPIYLEIGDELLNIAEHYDEMLDAEQDALFSLHEMRVNEVEKGSQAWKDLREQWRLEKLDIYKKVRALEEQAWKEVFRKHGYDGIVYPNAFEGAGESYMVFDPNQIKSVFNDSFDPNNPNILYQIDEATPEFREWWQDSKVVDEEGKPLRMFHGTPSREQIEAFDPEKIGTWNLYGKGFYFTSDPEIAGGSYIDIPTHKTFPSYEEAMAAPGRKGFVWETGEEWTAPIEDINLRRPGYAHSKDDITKFSIEDRTTLVNAIFKSRDWERALSPGYLSKSEREYLHKIINNYSRGDEGVAINWLYDQPYNINIENIAEKAGLSAPGTVYPVHLSIQNPINMDAHTTAATADLIIEGIKKLDAGDKWKYRGDLDELRSFMETGTYTHENLLRYIIHDNLVRQDLTQEGGAPVRFDMHYDTTELLQASGFDGLTHEGGQISGGKSHTVYVAFEPTQIKSTFNKRPTKNPKLLMQEAEAMGFEVDPIHYKNHETPAGVARKWAIPESGLVTMYHSTNHDVEVFIRQGILAGNDGNSWHLQAPYPSNPYKYTIEWEADLAGGEIIPPGSPGKTELYSTPAQNKQGEFAGIWSHQGDVPPSKILRIRDNDTQQMIYDRSMGGWMDERRNNPDWIETDNGARRVMNTTDDGAVVQGSDGTVEPVKLAGEEPPAIKAMPGTVDQEQGAAPPLYKMQEESWNNTIKPMLAAIQQDMKDPRNKVARGVGVHTLDETTTKQLQGYMEQVYANQRDTKLAALKWGEGRRDQALLNYSKRYGWDNLYGAIFPYHFWFTRSALYWAMNAIDRPGWIANYYRVQNIAANTEDQPGFPQRLKGKMRVPVQPFLPEWAGKYSYLEPLHQLFPWTQILQPYERWKKDQTQIMTRAEYLIEGWVADDTVTQEEATQAMQTHEGKLWQRALAVADDETDRSIDNPFDMVSMLTGPALPISIAYRLLRGEPEKISQLPVTRLVQAATAAFTPGGVNIEAPIRNALGIPEKGEFGEYYIDRELANMVADNTVSLDDAMQAMVDREGDVFTMAVDRVGKYNAARFAGGALWMDFFPEGEENQREMQLKWQRAVESGSEERIDLFFDENPEYKARLLMTNWNDPEQRIRKFLQSEIWTKYMELPSLEKRQATDHLGRLFQEAFLDSDTRSYESIPTETMAAWAQAIGGHTPTGVEPEGIAPPEFADPDLSKLYQGYVDQKKELFPNVTQLQSMYFNLPEDTRSEFLTKFPVITDYWRWKDQQLADNPDLIPYVVGDESALAGVDPKIQQLVYRYRAEKERLFPGVYELQNEYYDLPKAQRKSFRQQNPMLVEYWEWNRTVKEEYPEILPYITTKDSIEEIGEEITGIKPGEPRLDLTAEVPTDEIIIDTSMFSPPLKRKLLSYFLTGQQLGTGALKNLRAIWKKQGKPGGSFEDYVETVIRYTMT